MATLNKKLLKKLKIVTLEKYDRSRTKLRTFLTNINLYYKFNEVPNN